MKITTAKQSIERKNNDVCIVTEYPSIDKDLDFAIVKISGRYPETKQAMNQRCKGIVYVHSGTGQVTVNQMSFTLNPGDVVLIEAGESFFWEGNMTLHISCSPAFHIEQHVLV